jgi:serine/threonine protein kinase
MAMEVFSDIRKAVVHLHDCGVCHLDIKAPNIMVGDDDILRLTDFGLATDTMHPLMHACGTLPFSAPEVLDTVTNKVTYYGHLADCFAMGVLLFELCFGLGSMSKELGWQNRSCNELIQEPDLRASEMRKLLSKRDALCKRKFRRISAHPQQHEEAVLKALVEMLNPLSCFRLSMKDVSHALDN